MNCHNGGTSSPSSNSTTSSSGKVSLANQTSCLVTQMILTLLPKKRSHLDEKVKLQLASFWELRQKVCNTISLLSWFHSLVFSGAAQTSLQIDSVFLVQFCTRFSHFFLKKQTFYQNYWFLFIILFYFWHFHNLGFIESKNTLCVC